MSKEKLAIWGSVILLLCLLTSPWGRKESDTTERLHFHFLLSLIGEGNGNPLQCSCLENPRDGGAWWAAVYGVTQSRTRLKWFSSSSSNRGCDGRIINSMDTSLSKLWELVMDGEAWRAAVPGSQRVRRDWATELNWTELTWTTKFQPHWSSTFPF